GIGLIAMKTQQSVPSDQEEVKTFSTDGGFNLFQAKLKAVWADERITSLCSMMGNTEMLRQNAAAAKSEIQLSMRDVHRLREYTVRTASLRCDGCNHVCESRVNGDLRIADTLRYLMYSECYDDHDNAKALYRALSPNERDLMSVDLGPAAAACPQRIDIAKRLQDAAARFA
ncbi:MAG: aldo/keto reductase, partial [Candidatus Hydrogenedentota bacterium]